MKQEEINNANDEEPIKTTLLHCNQYDILYIFNKYIIDNKIKPYKDSIMSYLIKNNINGPKILKMTRKQFAQHIFQMFGNTKINQAAVTAYDKIVKFNFDEEKKNQSSYMHYK